MQDGDGDATLLDLVSSLIRNALDPSIDPRIRRDAGAALATLPALQLRRLAQDANWVVIGALLRPPAQQRNTMNAPHAALYGSELRRLSRMDLYPRVPLPRQDVPPDASPLERARRCANTEDVDLAERPDIAHRAAWTSMHVATVLIALGVTPRGDASANAIWAECERGGCARGVPPPLAKCIVGIEKRNPAHRDWLQGVMAWIESEVASRVDDLRDEETVRTLNCDLRLGIAESVRQNEILRPELLAAVELHACTHVLRSVGTCDVQVVRRESARRASLASEHLRSRNRSGHLLFDQALRGVMRAPGPSWERNLSPSRREALGFASMVRRTLEREGRTPLLE